MVLRLRSCLLKLTIYAWGSLLHRSASALTMTLKRLLSFVLSSLSGTYDIHGSTCCLLCFALCICFLAHCLHKHFPHFFMCLLNYSEHIPVKQLQQQNQQQHVALAKYTTRLAKKLSLAFCVCQTFRQGPLSFGTTSVVRVAGTAITTGKKEIHHLRD